MNRTIRVIGETETKAIEHLEELGKAKLIETYKIYNPTEPIYNAIFLAPMDKNSNDKLGLFVADAKYIILNEDLIEGNVDQNDIDNIFLHEMAHALDYALNGQLSGHSPLFRTYCTLLGVPKEFSKSKVHLAIDKSKRYISKLEKLKAMQSSPFENEAMIAISKAQKMMIEGNISKRKHEKIYLVDLFECKRMQFQSIKLVSLIKSITGVFAITISEENKKIERVYGEFEQVELSLYLYDYFALAIEQKIKELRKEGKHIDRRSFTIGLIEELEEKIKPEINSTSLQITKMETANKDKAIRLAIKSRIKSKNYSIKITKTQSMDEGSKFGKILDIPQKIKKRCLN